MQVQTLLVQLTLLLPAQFEVLPHCLTIFPTASSPVIISHEAQA